MRINKKNARQILKKKTRCSNTEIVEGICTGLQIRTYGVLHVRNASVPPDRFPPSLVGLCHRTIAKLLHRHP